MASEYEAGMFLCLDIIQWENMCQNKLKEKALLSFLDEIGLQEENK